MPHNAVNRSILGHVCFRISALGAHGAPWGPLGPIGPIWAHMMMIIIMMIMMIIMTMMIMIIIVLMMMMMYIYKLPINRTAAVTGNKKMSRDGAAVVRSGRPGC